DGSRRHENESSLHLLTSCAVAWNRPRHFAQSPCCRRERKQFFFFRFPSSGPRLFEGSQQRGATARPRAAVSVNGGVFEREPAGRGCGIFLGAAEGIRLAPYA